MSLWIPVTLAAASFQTVRFMLQKSLSNVKLSAAGATFARFAYSMPLAVLGLAVALMLTGYGLPHLTAKFWLFAVIGGTTQILATICVVALFKQRNFAVGITFKKTEVIQTAIVGFLVLGDQVSAGAFAAIILGLTAVLLLSKNPGGDGVWWKHLTNRASRLGLGSGVLFAFSSVSYRGASLELGDIDAWFRALVTLAVVVSFQFLSMGLWLLWRDRAELRAVWDTRRTGVFVGLTSLSGSFCWFLAFTLQNAAYVKALGQVELILSLFATLLFFRETITRREIAGMTLLGASIVVLVLSI
ncbi:phosphonate utilization associated putative membrane protein [Ruegeria sp. THAF57]|uniref:DMT family transporter n=1 Tax=Ruegeria sp. THAF57 TaxID=2744555 RepID=UPI0015DF6673|nr:DMT family transporter [Ruegeria sp. THAF57]CAD0185423.1 phosphonate utilization associated putative membrane protein [Ruegeria sp. THAF57]